MKTLIYFALFVVTLNQANGQALPSGADYLPYLVEKADLILTVSSAREILRDRSGNFVYEVQAERRLRGKVTFMISVSGSQWVASSKVKIAKGDILFLNHAMTTRAGTKAAEVVLSFSGIVKPEPHRVEAVELYLNAKTDAQKEAWAYRYLSEQDHFLRGSAVRTLVTIDSKVLTAATVQKLIEHVKSPGSPHVCQQMPRILSTLSEIGNADTVAAVKEAALRKENGPTIRGAAVRALVEKQPKVSGAWIEAWGAGKDGADEELRGLVLGMKKE